MICFSIFPTNSYPTTQCFLYIKKIYKTVLDIVQNMENRYFCKPMSHFVVKCCHFLTCFHFINLPSFMSLNSPVTGIKCEQLTTGMFTFVCVICLRMLASLQNVSYHVQNTEKCFRPDCHLHVRSLPTPV